MWPEALPLRNAIESLPSFWRRAKHAPSKRLEPQLSSFVPVDGTEHDQSSEASFTDPGQ